MEFNEFIYILRKIGEIRSRSQFFLLNTLSLFN
ncbi:unnamed protein product, partial [marine sediment metagenome]